MMKILALTVAVALVASARAAENLNDIEGAVTTTFSPEGCADAKKIEVRLPRKSRGWCRDTCGSQSMYVHN